MTLAAGGFADTVVDGPLVLAVGVSALAGLVSFLSPCVLPLVPGYISYVTGIAGADLDAAVGLDPHGRPVPAADPSGGSAASLRRTPPAAPPPPPASAHLGDIFSGYSRENVAQSGEGAGASDAEQAGDADGGCRAAAGAGSGAARQRAVRGSASPRSSP